MESAAHSHLRYRPEVDGLRAVAVLPVLLFHAKLGFTGGFVGVDVFFVISGFLITGLLLKDIDAGRFSLVDFWERRVRRIFPALAVMVAAVLAVGYVLLLPRDLEKLGETAVAQGLLAANIYFWRDIDYFRGPSELKPLLHTWSLAVEEQFYLGFPLLLWLIKSDSRRRMLSVLVALAIGSFALSVYGSYKHPLANFYLLPPRAWELLLGGILAALPITIRHRTTNEVISWLGLVSILAAAVVYDRSVRFPGVTALAPCLGTAAIILANGHGLTSVGRLLATRPMVFVGLISYSLYLWHWPVLAYVRYINLAIDWRLGVPALALSFVLATLSWRYVETPFRKRGDVKDRNRIFAGAAATLAVLLSVSALFWRSGGLPSRYAGESAGLMEDASWTGIEMARGVDDIMAGRVPEIGAPASAERPASFILWGDSHAMALTDLVDRLAREHNVAGYAAVSAACAPVPGTWNRYSTDAADDQMKRNDAVLKFILDRRIKDVILAARWAYYIDGWSPDERSFEFVDESQDGGPLADAQTPEGTPADSANIFRRHMESLIDELHKHGVEIWILKQVPEQPGPIAMQLLKRKRSLVAAPLYTTTMAAHRERQATTDKLMAELPADEVAIIDPTPTMFNASGEPVVELDGRACYKDRDHLSKYGAEKLLRPLLEPVFSAIAAKEQSAGRDAGRSSGAGGAVVP